jgi:hypothetical protein
VKGTQILTFSTQTAVHHTCQTKPLRTESVRFLSIARNAHPSSGISGREGHTLAQKYVNIFLSDLIKHGLLFGNFEDSDHKVYNLITNTQKHRQKIDQTIMPVFCVITERQH